MLAADDGARRIVGVADEDQARAVGDRLSHGRQVIGETVVEQDLHGNRADGRVASGYVSNGASRRAPRRLGGT